MQKQTKASEKLWSKYFILTFVYALFTSTANNMLLTGLPLYAIHLGGDNSISGLLFGLFMLFAILTRPLFGKLIDEKSRRLVLIAGGVISAVLSLSYVFAFSIGLLLLFRALHGFGFSATTNASGTIVSDIVPKSKLAEGIGYFGLANTLATAVGPALSLFIIMNFNYNLLFIVSSFIGFIALFCSFFINYEQKHVEPEHKLSTIKVKRKLTDMIYEKTALPTALVTIFIFVAMGATLTFIPTYALSLGIEDIGIYFTVYSFALLFTRIAGGKLADKYGYSFVIIPGLIMMVLSFVILAYATSLPAFLASAGLYGLGLGSVDPTLNAVMIRLCPPDRRGAGNSTLFTAKDIGGGFGAVILGFISLSQGFRSVYLYCALSIIIGLIAYHFILRKQISSMENTDAGIKQSA
ncbi:MFS transporter [Oceanobacillus chungangensis]|uniref:Arabinose ABC transporter permease n=1 Tax=Oceanobacillus chungangensis TaxID=1229152 RepID=A0A3D8PND7_9BACI|nr:MFS transporter [Oceanobacillus chungangensis]RDW16751.1 arabinose ABC transporter permease [Oceanobacillus chungangensis]